MIRLLFTKKTLPIYFTLLIWNAHAQQSSDSLLQQATLEQVVQYAIKHQPSIQQSRIDEETTNYLIKSKLADWYPQVTFFYNYQRNIELPTTIFDGTARKLGVTNISAPQLYATQNIFNRDVLLASKTARDVRINTREITTSRKIDLTVNVTKAFYDVLATSQQIKVGYGDIARLQQSLKTAQYQYNAGIVDKTDYKRATITLRNTQAVLKNNQELLNYKIEYLKALMGYPVHEELNITYDTLQMENEIFLDTIQQVDYTSRIEYQLYQTQRRLQEANLKYNQWSFLPTISAYGYWISNYQNNNFSDLYKTRYPNSYAGVQLTLPIFQGGKRIANIRQQKWSLKRIDWDIVNLKNTVNAQFTQALSAYKANLNTYQALRENLDLAKEVYDVIQLQYKSGVKTYLEVITAETDLRNSRINYFNALYQVLASKIDLQKALGQINY